MYDMKQKEVINVSDGARLGLISDLEIDAKTGKIKKIIIPGKGKIFGVFGREQEYHISWDDIKRVGDDIVLVDVDTEDVLEEI